MSVVNIFVALGTLALASATYLLARTTKLMLQETYRGRIDANAPNVTVIASPDTAIIPEVVRSRFIQSTPQLAQISDADLVEVAKEAIGLSTRISLRNEGQVSAFARFDYLGRDEAVVAEASSNEDGLTTEVVDGWYVIPRDSERHIMVKWTLPAADWRDASESGQVLEAESWIMRFPTISGHPTSRSFGRLEGCPIWERQGGSSRWNSRQRPLIA